MFSIVKKESNTHGGSNKHHTNGNNVNVDTDNSNGGKYETGKHDRGK